MWNGSNREKKNETKPNRAMVEDVKYGSQRVLLCKKEETVVNIVY